MSKISDISDVNLQDFKKILEVFYTTHNPERVGTINLILESYKGRERELLIHLGEKYSHEKVQEAILASGVAQTSEDGDNVWFLPPLVVLDAVKFHNQEENSTPSPVSRNESGNNRPQENFGHNYHEMWKKDQTLVAIIMILLILITYGALDKSTQKR